MPFRPGAKLHCSARADRSAQAYSHLSRHPRPESESPGQRSPGDYHWTSTARRSQRHYGLERAVRMLGGSGRMLGWIPGVQVRQHHPCLVQRWLNCGLLGGYRRELLYYLPTQKPICVADEEPMIRTGLKIHARGDHASTSLNVGQAIGPASLRYLLQ